MKSFLDSIKERKSIYVLSDDLVMEDEALEALVKTVAKHVPSAFNMQSQRVVLLLKEDHHTLWNIVLETLRKIVPEKAFGRTENKIKTSFAAGSATILFFEDEAVVESMANQFPDYKESFKTWSVQANGMMQYAIWTALEAQGYGSSLQHYNPLIDEAVRQTWKLPDSWKLFAQMPLGKPEAVSGDKKYIDIDEKVKVFK